MLRFDCQDPIRDTRFSDSLILNDNVCNNPLLLIIADLYFYYNIKNMLDI
ncbi:hypothetical protein yinte0001_19950 [Yersinia intermedia ATCC 29909]|nr:hypothetical protein yinte0001_19950 [Yersinia intermedia ATCC 29909]